MIKFRAMKNVGPLALSQFRVLNAGSGRNGGVMIEHVDVKDKAYVSYVMRQGRVLGWASLLQDCPHWNLPLIGVFVDKEFRSKGIASRLVKDVLKKGMRYIDTSEYDVMADTGQFEKYYQIFDEMNLPMEKL